MKIDGKTFCGMCISGANALDNHKAEIDNLNVFPVPDGDTGSNMSMTMSTVHQLEDFNGSLSECACRISGLLLRAARGNSGAILSLFFKGFSKALDGVEAADTSDIAQAFLSGTQEAYGAVMNPTEGTILTVMRICAEKATKATADGRYKNDSVGFFAYLLKTANDALAKTPSLLPMLAEAGVVDAGGRGFVTLVSGMLDALNLHPVNRVDPEYRSEEKADFSFFQKADIKYHYCTECIIEKSDDYKKDGAADDLKGYLASLGDSLVYIEDTEIIKIHVHTNAPGSVLEKALTYGELASVKIENMTKQHSELIEKKALEKQVPCSIVAVCPNAGVADVYKDAGVKGIVYGGQTANPSTGELLEAIQRQNADTVYILPNNKNIILVAEQAANNADCRVIVIPTRSFPEGIAAVLALDPANTPEENQKAMSEAAKSIRTLSFTKAVKDAVINGNHVKEGETIGLLDGKIEASSCNVPEALSILLTKNAFSPVYITVYVGEPADEAAVADTLQILHEHFPDADFARVDSRQPLYDFVISVE